MATKQDTPEALPALPDPFSDHAAAIEKVKAEARREQIAGLRDLANFFEANPSVEMSAQHYLIYVFTAEELAAYARLGSWQKVYDGDFYQLVKTFSGGLKLKVYTNRDQVCRKVVTGQRVVPAQPATEERIEDIEEWICEESSLLAKAGGA